MTPETLFLPPDTVNGFPNATLAVLIYRGAVKDAEPESRAKAFEALFERHGWPPAWRYHLYDFHHFHADAHEVLGVFRGRARAQLGGPDGPLVTLAAGDALVLPAGTGHACLSDEGDFCMVGAYPTGQQPDLERGDPARMPMVEARIARVSAPERDPFGVPLGDNWPRSA